jgi:signal recognition particle subunit SRP54
MTPKERHFPKILDGKRKRRVAAGSGTKVEEVNRLLKMHRQMADMMKSMGKQRGGIMQRMMGLGGGGPNPAELERLQADLARLDPKALERLPKNVRQQLPGRLPGLGGSPHLPSLPALGAPTLPGLPGLPRKKK